MLTQLSILLLLHSFFSHNKLERLPATLGNLQSLSLLRLEHNKLSELGEDMGKLVLLEELVSSKVVFNNNNYGANVD